EVVALRRVPDKAAFRGERDLVASATYRLAADLLGQALAVGGRGVDQTYAVIDGSLDRGDRLPLVGTAPHPATDGPSAEPDDARIYAGRADLPLHHLMRHRAGFPSFQAPPVRFPRPAPASRDNGRRVRLGSASLSPDLTPRRWYAGSSQALPAPAQRGAGSADSRPSSRRRGS